MFRVRIDYKIENGALLECITEASHLYIPFEVRTIRKTAFANCRNLTSITIPETFTNIHKDTFSYCERLVDLYVDNYNPKFSSVDGIIYDKKKRKIICVPKAKEGHLTLPDTLRGIATEAFKDCVNIKSIDTGDKVKRINVRAFEGCINLSHIRIGKKVNTIEDLAFMGCENLNSIIIPDNVEKMDRFVFEKLLTIQSRITIFAKEGSFAQKYAEDYNFPFEKIDNTTLLQATSYYPDYDFEIPSGITEIASHAFSGCSEISTIIIPETVTKIAPDAFEECYGLKRIIVNKDNEEYTSIEGVLYNKDRNKILWVPAALRGPVCVPYNVAGISYTMFKDCKKLQTIELTYTMSSIDWDTDILDAEDNPLNSVYFEVDKFNPNFTSLNGILYDKLIEKILYVPRAIPGRIVLPDSLYAINEKNFINCKYITELNTGNGITTINPNSVVSCKRLERIVIGPKVSYIDDNAFSKCYNVKEIIVHPDNELFYTYNNVLYDKYDHCVYNPEGEKIQKEEEDKEKESPCEN